jgi:hypothetical protein
MRSTLDFVPTLLFIVSASLNAIQMREISKLRVGASTGSGVQAVPISAKDPSGASAQIEFSGPVPTIVYVFSPQCGWCERNWPGVRALAEQVRGPYRVVALSLASRGLAAQSEGLGLSFPVYSDPSPESQSAYRMGATPQTLVVSAGGRVERVWVGAYAGRVKAEVERFFDVTLPAL